MAAAQIKVAVSGEKMSFFKRRFFSILTAEMDSGGLN